MQGVEASPARARAEVLRLRAALDSADRSAVAAALSRLSQAIHEDLGVPGPEVAVLEVRPRFPGAELHGLYTRDPAAGGPLLMLWMRTHKHRRVVAFRTFLRTFLHELCHHLDFELLGLPASFHTLGSFQRETSLFHQLVPEARARRGRQAPARPLGGDPNRP